MSPKKKKAKKPVDIEPNLLKRENESEGSSSKRSNAVKNHDEDLQVQRRKNFVTACEQVSCKAYCDHRARLLLLYLPSCMQMNVCKHHNYKGADIKQIMQHVEELIMIDIKNHMWCNALEMCTLSITPSEYLSANVLKAIVEIILNAHKDEFSRHTISYIIAKCQQILSHNFSTHPPCPTKSLRLCYKTFLTSPLDSKEKTFTNRSLFGHNKGVVKFCMNRLEYEISSESKDECLVNMDENMPREIKETVRELYWQKQTMEIYESLERKERIERLMAVLECIVELLQFDLAIWHSRYKNNLGSHIMRSHKPLMASILWSNNVLFTGAVNNNCRQILKIFTQMVHLKYPQRYIRIMTIWLNAVIQTFYICETNSNSDYPNIGKYCTAFANEFYKIIAEMSHDSIIRILEAVKPTYMKHLLGTLHLKKILSTEEDDVIINLIDFIKHSKWKKYAETVSDIKKSTNVTQKQLSTEKKLRCLVKQFHGLGLREESEDINNDCYLKIDSIPVRNEINCNNVILTLFITLDAYLDTYSVTDVQKTLDRMNENLVFDNSNVSVNSCLPEITYSVSEQFIKKYRSIYQMLKELVLLFEELKRNGGLLDILEIFKRIEFLGL